MLGSEVVPFVHPRGRRKAAAVAGAVGLVTGCGRIGYDLVKAERDVAFHRLDASAEASVSPGDDARVPRADGSDVDARAADARLPPADVRMPPPDARAPFDAADREADAREAPDGGTNAEAGARFDATSLAAGLVGYWKLDEGAGGIAADGHDGRLLRKPCAALLLVSR